jgi:hypothetical protein
MNRTIKRTLVIIAAIIIVSGTIWIVVARRPKTESVVQVPAIVSAPNPRIGEALPPDIQPPPTPKPAAKPPVAIYTQPRGPAANMNTNTNYGVPQPSPSVSTKIHVYRNDQLQFSVILPASWTAASDIRLANEIFFVGPANEPEGSVESYNAPAGQTIDALEQTLHGDPSASNFERVSFRGQAGIGYWLKGDNLEHFAFIVNGKIYYVRGEDVLMRLNFISQTTLQSSTSRSAQSLPASGSYGSAATPAPSTNSTGTSPARQY